MSHPTKPKCTVSGCPYLRRRSTEEFCDTHRSRLRRTGDVKAHVPIRSYVKPQRGWFCTPCGQRVENLIHLPMVLNRSAL